MVIAALNPSFGPGLGEAILMRPLVLIGRSSSAVYAAAFTVMLIYWPSAGPFDRKLIAHLRVLTAAPDAYCPMIFLYRAWYSS